MEETPQPKATLVVKIMDHGTITGTEDEVDLEFEDSVSAVDGLVGWLADGLSGGDDTERREAGAAILIEALHRWTFWEYVDEDMEEEDDETSQE